MYIHRFFIYSGCIITDTRSKGKASWKGSQIRLSGLRKKWLNSNKITIDNKIDIIITTIIVITEIKVKSNLRFKLLKTVSFNYVFRYIVPERNCPILVTIQSCSFDLIKLIRMVHSPRLWTKPEDVFKYQIIITKDYILCTRFIRMNRPP